MICQNILTDHLFTNFHRTLVVFQDQELSFLNFGNHFLEFGSRWIETCVSSHRLKRLSDVLSFKLSNGLFHGKRSSEDDATVFEKIVSSGSKG